MQIRQENLKRSVNIHIFCSLCSLKFGWKSPKRFHTPEHWLLTSSSVQIPINAKSKLNIPTQEPENLQHALQSFESHPILNPMNLCVCVIHAGIWLQWCEVAQLLQIFTKILCQISSIYFFHVYGKFWANLIQPGLHDLNMKKITCMLQSMTKFGP